MLAPKPPDQMENIRNFIPTTLLSKYDNMVLELTQEVDSDHEFSLRKAIGKNCRKDFLSLFLPY